MMDDLLSAAECGLPSCPIKFELASHYQNSNPQNSEGHSRILYYEDSQPPKDGAGHKMWGDGLSALFRRLSFTRDSQGIVADAWLGMVGGCCHAGKPGIEG